ncbi:MAG TPA: cytochrome c biogenesis protein CcdA, partial [Bacillota bacterium]|nr:cytochrome c biogenesis protein CcdA [Bacillota bacterium]
SLGLGVPFVISALMLEKLRTIFGFVKKNYRIINAVSGGFLILIGILMMTGYLNRLLLSFSR